MDSNIEDSDKAHLMETSINHESAPFPTDSGTIKNLDESELKSKDKGPSYFGSNDKTELGFHVHTGLIPCVPEDEQDDGLFGLGVNVYDQTQFESEVLGQVDKALKAQEEKKRQQEVQKELKAVSDDIRFANQRLSHIEKALSMAPKEEAELTNTAKREIASIKKEQENKLKHLKKLEAKQRALQACMTGNAEELNSVQNHCEEEEMDEETIYHLQKVFAKKETEEEKLIRTGQMTPFGTVLSNEQNMPKPRKIIIPENDLTDFDKFLLNQVQDRNHKKISKTKITHKTSMPSTSTASMPSTSGVKKESPSGLIAVTAQYHKKLVKSKLGSKHAIGYKKKFNAKRSLVTNYCSDSDVSDFELNDVEDEYLPDGDEEFVPGEILSDDSDDEKYCGTAKKLNRKKMKMSPSKDLGNSESESQSPKKKFNKIADDGNQKLYVKRLKKFEKDELIKKHEKILESDDGIIDSDDESFTEFEGGFKIPNNVWDKLYKYQQTGVRWLWELHQQNCGGIVGDEMGLGKTIQVISFFVGLNVSKLQTDGDVFQGLGPVILVCPATVMHQWVREFHSWWPPFRVAILHESGSFNGIKASLIRAINKSNGVLITSYAGVVQHQTGLLDHEWHYVVLDEGHKIRNPDSQATLVAKQFRTQHRLILSGSPVQNNLKELWSLFDFIFPGKLGTLPIFMQQFSVPIVQGGYANATQVQVQTAYKCATVLRDTIKPYLLRRMKSDVKMSINLPDKNEQVLFCQLAKEQVDLYKGYIASKEVESIINARLQIFVGLINLRKICNHPDLFDGGPKIFKDTDVGALSEDMQYGYYKRSGKMIVVEALLRLWHKQGHKVLLFTQGKQMMDILEIFVKEHNYTYMKMSGSTSISSRQPAINKFNSNPDIFVFLLTTRVGGLGVNLTGADRVVIFDPDWNPSTDSQARERAWRIGQDKQVTIYRLLTAGTIEEKIYHRQIFKQFVTNRVLKDPQQRRFFKSNDLYELFTFVEMGSEGTETSAIFAGTGSEVRPVNRPSESERKSAVKPMKNEIKFSAEKVNQMKQLAKKLSMELCKKSNALPNLDLTVDKSNVDSSEMKAASATIKIGDATSDKLKRSRTPIESAEQEKKKRKHHKRKRHAVVDGEKIDYLVKTDVYKPEMEEDGQRNDKQDDYVLSKLFKKSGVHTALKHDVIVEASAPDYMLVEGEANKVAKDAIKALRESRRMCARAEEGIPTWTGAHGGMKPRFGTKKKLPLVTTPASSPDTPGPSGITLKPTNYTKKLVFDGQTESTTHPPSSSDLLSVIRNRKHVFGTDEHSDCSDGEEARASVTALRPTTKHDELLVEIRNFIAFRAEIDGRASTKEILENFKDSLPVHQTAVFKALLSKICDFSRTTLGNGIWQLKEEFR